MPTRKTTTMAGQRVRIEDLGSGYLELPLVARQNRYSHTVFRVTLPDVACGRGSVVRACGGRFSRRPATGKAEEHGLPRESADRR
jgi:hypothetical protein